MDAGFGDERVRLGHRINYYMFASQCGGFDDESEAAARIETDLKSTFGIDLREPDGLIAAALDVGNLFTLGRAMPYSLPFYLYYRSRNLGGPDLQAREFCGLAALLAVQGLRIDFQNLFVYHALFEKASTFGATAGAGSVHSARLEKMLSLMAEIAGSVPELRTCSPGLFARGKRKLMRIAERLLRRRFGVG